MILILCLIPLVHGALLGSHIHDGDDVSALATTLLDAPPARAHPSHHAGIVLKDLNLHVRQSTGDCKGPHCKQLDYVFRVVRGGTSTTPLSPPPSQPHADQDASMLGKRVRIRQADGKYRRGILGDVRPVDEYLIVWEETGASLAMQEWIHLVIDEIELDPDQAPTTDDAFGAVVSAAFFAWLALPPDDFVVNLNPSQPDRVIDAKLAATQAGAILLEADFQLKNQTAWLMHPDHPIGKQYWQDVDIPFPTPELCLAFRTWITSGDAAVEVVEVGDYLYVVAAPLSVMEESDFLTTGFAHASIQAVTGCATTEPYLQQRAEALFKEQILPAITEHVHRAPIFKLLRYVYYWRVIAEWYRQREGEVGWTDESWQTHSVAHGQTLARHVFDKYVDSVQRGAYAVKKLHRVPVDGTSKLFRRSYAQGRIDFQRAPPLHVRRWRDIGEDEGVGLPFIQ